ncbi:MAG: PTS sugar transporter subunit IIA [Lentisphaeraceae bacterium]|nr:PTS sugar transporter subunit IIA [Lentisphaeraceae bacterium]
MDLTRLLPASHCVVNMTATTRAEALEQLMQPLVDTGIITDADEFTNDLERREQQITTVVGNGVAIPHARTQSATRLGLSVGFLPEGTQLKFSDEEEVEEVNLLFMIAIPSFAPASHLPLLQHIAKFIRYEKKVAKLMRSKTPAATAKYLHSFKTK